MNSQVSGIEPGQRHLNGPQTTGRDYRSLSAVEFDIHRTNDVPIALRDGTKLQADLFQPDANGRFPALIAVSPYPRQIQDFGIPLGMVEAGASDFFVPRGYAQVIVNLRGTSGSEGTWTMMNEQEREDLYDIVEWVAAQPWCDGNVGMLGVSYFAMTQLSAAVMQPPHLKAIFPLAVSDDLYSTIWHNGLLNSGFLSGWFPAVGIQAGKDSDFWRGEAFHLLKRVFTAPQVHKRLEHMNGEAALMILKQIMRAHYNEEPFGRLWQEMCIEHPTRDAYWDERDNLSLLDRVKIPVYLGCDWDNVPMHLGSTFTSWRALSHNPNVRVGLLPPGGLSWPWESMHYEALAWYDHWLKGRDTGIMEGPPIRYVVSGTEDWRSCATWPPPESTLTPFALRADGVLTRDEGDAGSRQYLYLPVPSDRPTGGGPPALPSSLHWETEPLPDDMEFAGNIELQLDASITARDTGWIVTLYDVPVQGESTAITVGWLRASLSRINEEKSEPGYPVYDCREPVLLPVGERVVYRIPLVPNAHRIAKGNRLRLTVASADDQEKKEAMLGFTHTPIREASVNTIYSTSRLLLPILPCSPA